MDASLWILAVIMAFPFAYNSLRKRLPFLGFRPG